MTDRERWTSIHAITIEVDRLISERDRLTKRVEVLKPDQLNMVLHHATHGPVHTFINSLVPLSTPDYIDRYTAHIDAEIRRKQKQIHTLTK